MKIVIRILSLINISTVVVREGTTFCFFWVEVMVIYLEKKVCYALKDDLRNMYLEKCRI